MHRKWLVATVALGACVAFTACSRGNNQASDTALSNDLSLAAQQKQAQLDSLSDSANAAKGQAVASTSERRSHTSYRRRSSSEEVRSDGEVVSSAPASSEGTVVKHTKRDAVIGAATGAVVGGVAGHGVKGGIIGAAVGGILGGVIGNNVDKTKKP